MLKDDMEADDVTQEMFIKIWENLGKFKMASAKTWIMRSTHNLCIDYLRRRSVKLNRVTVIDEETENYVLQDEDNDPQLITHLKMMKTKVTEAIKELPETLKSVFVMYEINGMKYKEISSALGIPINSVKVYLLRARKKLQELLKNYETGEVV